MTADRTADARHYDYAARSQQVQDMLLDLSQLVAEHAEKSATSNDWGFNGDLGHLQEKLAELLDFMKG